jgi:hypothetical protein
VLSEEGSDYCSLISDGAIAQLGERLLCKQEVVGSIPSGSTRLRAAKVACRGLKAKAGAACSQSACSQSACSESSFVEKFGSARSRLHRGSVRVI